MAAASPYGKGLVGLLKKSWNEIPAVMVTTLMALTTLATTTYAIVEYEKSGRYDAKYKTEFVIYRSDDPRAKRLTREGL